MKCRIQWIDTNGKPTPDNNEAIGVAVCIDGEGDVLSAHPICEEHAARIETREKYRASWRKVTGHEPSCLAGWHLMRFPKE